MCFEVAFQILGSIILSAGSVIDSGGEDLPAGDSERLDLPARE